MILVKPEVCMGCHICEIYCIVAHSRSKDIIKAFMLENPRAKPRIIIEENLPECFALQCRNCEEPMCMFACISGAIYRENGIIKHDEKKCVSCLSCLMACPYGAIRVENGKVYKCDFCNLEFYCVKFCPNNALEVVD